jgi:EpsI family protein
MQKLRNRYFIIILIFGMTLILVRFFSHTKDSNSEKSANFVEQIPMRLEMWHGTDMLLEEKVYEILESRSIVHRKYIRDGESVFLSIVYYPEVKVDFHTPEHCLAGQGIEIRKSVETIEIEWAGKTILVDLYQLIRKYDHHDELIYYFYKTGAFFGPSYIRLRFALVMNKFFSQVKGGGLIRVTTPISAAGKKSAEERLADFINALYPYLIQYL